MQTLELVLHSNARSRIPLSRLPRYSVQGGPGVIRKEAWSFYRSNSGVRLCLELEEPKGPKGGMHWTIVSHLPPSLPHPLPLASRCRGTSLIRKRTPLGPYRRPVPGVLGGSQGGGIFLWARYPCTPAPPPAVAPTPALAAVPNHPRPPRHSSRRRSHREIGISLPNNQRQHRTLHIQENVLPYVAPTPAVVGVAAASQLPVRSQALRERLLY